MDTIKIMINGIPGNMAVNVASLAQNDGRFIVIPYSFLSDKTVDRLRMRLHRSNYFLLFVWFHCSAPRSLSICPAALSCHRRGWFRSVFLPW